MSCTMERRQFIKGSGAALTVGMAGLAGCSTGILGGGGGSFGDVTAWLPAPAEFDSDLDHYQFTARSPSQVADVSDDTTWDITVAPNADFGNPPADDVDYVIGANPSTDETRQFTVYVGDFDAEWISTKLESRNFDQDRGLDEFDVYVQPTDGSVPQQTQSDVPGRVGYAVNDSTVIRTVHRSPEDESDPIGVAQTIADANAGDAPTYAENQDMGALGDTISIGQYVTAQTFEPVEESLPQAGQFEDLVGRGETHTVQGAETDISEVLVFLSESAVIEREIESYIDESGQFNSYHSRPEYSIDGRTVSITGTTGTQMADWI